MTLSDLAAIGSFISGIGVLVSLIYLGYQVRQSALTHRASAYQGRLDFLRERIRDTMDPAIGSLMQRVNDGDETLTDLECQRYLAQQGAFFIGYDHLFWLHDNKMLDEAAFQSDRIALSGALTQPGVRASWEIIKNISTPRFRELVEGHLANASPGVPTTDMWRTHWRAARKA